MKSVFRFACLVGLSLVTSSWLAYAENTVPSTQEQGGGQPVAAPEQNSSGNATIPGPLRPLLRMAGVSLKVEPDEVLPLLSRNVVLQGYSLGRRTEFLTLLTRYVGQARELSHLAGPRGVIRVSNCAESAPLLAILGYRLRQECGQKGASLETADPERAFVTTDSGFPLPELEQTLAGGPPFVYPFPASAVPAIFTENQWVNAGKTSAPGSQHLLDVLLHDPNLARLYWALSRLDADTRHALWSQVGMDRLARHAAVLDFYGDHICIRDGRVLVPGGPAAEPAWAHLVGASPESPGKFVEKLISKDRGWLATYFDVLSRARPEQQEYFTEPDRLARFYAALLLPGRSDDATRGAFRPAPRLLLLVTRLQRDSSGQPIVPGGIEVWKDVLRQKGESNPLPRRVQRANQLATPEQLVEAMFALTRVRTEAGPLQMYLVLSELDSRRSAGNRLSPETAQLMVQKFELFSSQYRIFSEFPELSNESIALFLNVAQSLDGISARPLRGDALGTFQANVGLWQVLARQHQTPDAELNDSWQGMIRPFSRIRSAADLYDAGRASLARIVQSASGKNSVSQGELVDLLAGPAQTDPEAMRMHREFVDRIFSILDSQRLVSLDTLIALGDALNDKAQGKPVAEGIAQLAGQLREFQMPQPIFSNSERTEWAAGIYNNSHTEAEMRTDLTKAFKSSASRNQLLEAKGQLSSFLRDTLVALNYAYYEPPGAQMLHHNPLFVRSHDFAAETVEGIKGVWRAPQMFGEGSPAGGGAHLVGSLADLPYVLAQIEQDFIAPENVQALIWRELVPTLLTSAVLPRWWGVTHDEMHAIALYQRAGEEILAASPGNPELRTKVLAILSERMSPMTLRQVEQRLRRGQAKELMEEILPADTFYLAAEFRHKFPEEVFASGPANQELQALCRSNPRAVEWDRLSRDFGVPHPTLAQTYARELLNLEPIPAFEGHASRLLAESWDSSNLYWARLLDEAGDSPVVLNHLVPELTRRMVEKVAATNFEDWPALLRAMRETGDEFRQGRMESAESSRSLMEHHSSPDVDSSPADLAREERSNRRD